jgi:hypothetical protein
VTAKSIGMDAGSHLLARLSQLLTWLGVQVAGIQGTWDAWCDQHGRWSAPDRNRKDAGE